MKVEYLGLNTKFTAEGLYETYILKPESFEEERFLKTLDELVKLPKARP
ncbi:hypothetical protein BMS3Abin17_01404 [archaeon BMS3Abin17]|nr:hypothetical protein BMS3Abin17_01404 [archaeon BMS3Abin17]